MLGKLTWNAIPWDQPIPLVAGAAVFSIAIAVVAWVVLKGHLPYLWREWITSERLTNSAPVAVSQKLVEFKVGKATSRAPSCNGTAKFIRPIISGIAAKKIMMVPCAEKI